MAAGRQVLQHTAGRLTTYVPPSNGGQRAEGVVRYLSAEDDIFDTDNGQERLRAITVNASIGTASGAFKRLDIGGMFLIDVDGTGTPEPWTIAKFANSDAEAGYKRCLCTRPILQKGTLGAPRRDR